MSRRDRLKEMEPAGRRATAALCRALALVLILALFPAGLAEAPEPNEVEPNEVQPNEVEPGEVELGEVDLSSLLEPDGKLPTEAPGDAPRG